MEKKEFNPGTVEDFEPLGLELLGIKKEPSPEELRRSLEIKIFANLYEIKDAVNSINVTLKLWTYSIVIGATVIFVLKLLNKI